MTIEEVRELFLSMGVKKRFKVSVESETGTIHVLTRRFEMRDGRLVGSAITLRDELMGGERRRAPDFIVWTERKKLARALAAEHGLRYRGWDGEAELIVPGSMADELLPKFGAKVKREQGEAHKARLADARWRGLKKIQALKNGASGVVSSQNGG